MRSKQDGFVRKSTCEEQKNYKVNMAIQYEGGSTNKLITLFSQNTLYQTFKIVKNDIYVIIYEYII